MIALAWSGVGVALSIIFAAWKIDEHFVTRREFNVLVREVRMIREHLGRR